jgi:hypothetical protein
MSYKTGFNPKVVFWEWPYTVRGDRCIKENPKFIYHFYKTLKNSLMLCNSKNLPLILWIYHAKKYSISFFNRKLGKYSDWTSSKPPQTATKITASHKNILKAEEKAATTAGDGVRWTLCSIHAIRKSKLSASWWLFIQY